MQYIWFTIHFVSGSLVNFSLLNLFKHSPLSHDCSVYVVTLACKMKDKLIQDRENQWKVLDFFNITFCGMKRREEEEESKIFVQGILFRCDEHGHFIHSHTLLALCVLCVKVDRKCISRKIDDSLATEGRKLNKLAGGQRATWQESESKEEKKKKKKRRDRGKCESERVNDARELVSEITVYEDDDNDSSTVGWVRKNSTFLCLFNQWVAHYYTITLADQ